MPGNPRGRPIRKFPLTAFDAFLGSIGFKPPTRSVYKSHVRTLILAGSDAKAGPTTEQLAEVLRRQTPMMQGIMRSAWNRWRDYQKSLGREVAVLPSSVNDVNANAIAQDPYMAELLALLSRICFMYSIPARIFAQLQVRHLIYRRSFGYDGEEYPTRWVLNAYGRPIYIDGPGSVPIIMRMLELCHGNAPLLPTTPLIVMKSSDCFPGAYITRLMADWMPTADIQPPKRKWIDTPIEELPISTDRIERDARFEPMPTPFRVEDLIKKFYEGKRERYEEASRQYSNNHTFMILENGTIGAWLEKLKTTPRQSSSSNEAPSLDSSDASRSSNATSEPASANAESAASAADPISST